MSDSLQPHGLYSPWSSPGQNTGVGSLSLLQGIFPIHGSKPGLLHCRWVLYQLSHKGSPRILEWASLSTELLGKPFKDYSCTYIRHISQVFSFCCCYFSGCFPLHVLFAAAPITVSSGSQMLSSAMFYLLVISSSIFFIWHYICIYSMSLPSMLNSNASFFNL